MFDQNFLPTQAKRRASVSNKHGIQNTLRVVKQLNLLGSYEISRKSQTLIEFLRTPQPPPAPNTPPTTEKPNTQGTHCSKPLHHKPPRAPPNHTE